MMSFLFDTMLFMTVAACGVFVIECMALLAALVATIVTHVWLRPKLPNAIVVRGGVPRCTKCRHTYSPQLARCLCTWAKFEN